MVSLWGTNKKDDDEEPEQNGVDDDTPRATSSHSQNQQPSRRSEDTNERTRLLPQHDIPRTQRGGPGYLHPDDPAVSTSTSSSSSQLTSVLGITVQSLECESSEMV